MIIVIGPIRHEISRRELEEANALVVPDVEFVRTSFTYEFADDWADMIAALIRDADRNESLCGIILKHLGAGRHILVLSQRVEHCEELYRTIESARPGRAVLAVGTRKRERQEAIRRIATGNADVMFATQLADEGLDAPILDTLILATPQRSENRTMQRAGRVLRALSGKRQPLIVDLVDFDIGALRNQAWSRFFGVYRELSPKARLPEWLAYRRKSAA
jgi:superfamily II DNA or RNA helicase